MVKEVKKILFATDLSKECQHSYDFAVSLAMSCSGSITLLHVMEPPPVSMETQVKDLLGEERYDAIMREHEKDTRSILIGKRKESDIIHSALYKLCEDTKNNQAGCYLQPDEILIKRGEIIKEILATAATKEIDLIVLSAHKSMLSDTAVSKIVKGILRLSKIPVLVVPPPEEE